MFLRVLLSCRPQKHLVSRHGYFLYIIKFFELPHAFFGPRFGKTGFSMRQKARNTACLGRIQFRPRQYPCMALPKPAVKGKQRYGRK